jgi:two-component system sensor histidine kinase KdpD
VTSPLPVVIADAALLERSLANLVENSLRHTEGPVEIEALDRPDAVGIAVVDHGRGVAVELHDRMFEPFQRLGDTPAAGQTDGLGLGLAVARGLVEAQGGRLRAEETRDGGLTMVVELGRQA